MCLRYLAYSPLIIRILTYTHRGGASVHTNCRCLSNQAIKLYQQDNYQFVVSLYNTSIMCYCLTPLTYETHAFSQLCGCYIRWTSHYYMYGGAREICLLNVEKISLNRNSYSCYGNQHHSSLLSTANQTR